MFSTNRCGLFGLFLQEFLAAVQVTHKLHLSDTKASIYLSERVRMFWLFYSFMSFNLKCLFYPQRGSDFFQRTNLLPVSELAKPAVGSGTHTSLPISFHPLPAPTHFQPVSNIHPTLSWRFGSDLLYILLYFKQSKTTNKESLFSAHNCQWGKSFPKRHTPKP